MQTEARKVLLNFKQKLLAKAFMIIYASYAVRDRRRLGSSAPSPSLANVRYAFGVQQIAVALLGHKSNWSYGNT